MQSFENKVIAGCDKAASDDFEKHFAAHAALIRAQNKSSTLFCPNGFEFFKNKINVKIEKYTVKTNFFLDRRRKYKRNKFLQYC